ncbi:hypothetical protein AVS7_04375 [Acidovorax sp. MR-S7]|nr:hypothetical protein AVS7_04375 [Acidovorax sp. MR-S7]
MVALYLNPFESTLVLCVDEKSQCLALERTQVRNVERKSATAPRMAGSELAKIIKRMNSWLVVLFR